MQGLEWGMLYHEYHGKAYNPAEVSNQVKKLYGDTYLKNRKGIFKYVFGGLVHTNCWKLVFLMK